MNRITKNPIFAANYKGTDRVLGQVDIDFQAPVFEITNEFRPLVVQVVQSLPGQGARWYGWQALVQPVSQLLSSLAHWPRLSF